MPRRLVFLAALGFAACSSPAEVKKAVKTPVVAVKTPENKDAPDKPRRTKRPRNEAPNGEVAKIVLPGNHLEITDKDKSTRTIEGDDTFHPPAGERGLIGISPQTVTFLDDNTMMLGIGDGTLLAFDKYEKPRWSIGFRGAVTGITIADDDRVIITTMRGVVAAVKSTNGEVLWEKHLVSGALSPAIVGSDDHIYVAGPRGVLAFSEDGALLFSHALTLPEDICCKEDPKDAFAVDDTGRITAKGLDIRVSDPHPFIVDSLPTYVVDYEKVLDEPISRVISAGPDELWLLVRGKKGSELVRYAGGKTKRFAIPSRAEKAELWPITEKAEIPNYEIDTLTSSPKGEPWILGRAIFAPQNGELSWARRPARGIILELNGNKVRERKDLKTKFEEIYLNTGSDSLIHATEIGNSRLLCFGGGTYGDDDEVCALYENAQPEILPFKDHATSVSVIGKNTYVVPRVGLVVKLDGRSFIPIPSPEDSHYSISAVGGTGENDLWFTNAGEVAYHWDGKTMTATSLPVAIESGVVAYSPTDVWSRNGLAHWDGKRWSLVAEARGAAGLVVRGPNDIWVGNRFGLFHSKPSTRTLLRLPEAKINDTKPLDAPKVLPLGAEQTGYQASKTSLVVKGSAPVSTAKRVEVARDGTLWLEAWDKLVEIDAQLKTTVLDDKEKRIAFNRWFYPEGAGRGIFTHRERESERYNYRDELRRFENGKSVEAASQLWGHDIVAISGNATGTTWILGSIEGSYPYELRRTNSDELGIHALVRGDEKSPFQVAAGLPAVAYRDVAVTPEGGGFFVGALNSGPMGEGVIVHARGRLGVESVTRYRAHATIFAAAAVSNDEAWAVGAMGLVVHIKGNVIERHVIPSGTWLRAVVANGPNDVWIGGDDGTILHYDGSAFHPVNQPLGNHAAFSGLGISRGVVWATSPSGIVRIVKN